MKVYNGLEYKRTKRERDKLEKLLKDLDFVGEVLYNNLDYKRVWELIRHYEEVRIYYFVQYEFYNRKLKNIGKEITDEKTEK